eukprot:2730611-Rhodomonas_salina.1
MHGSRSAVLHQRKPGRDVVSSSHLPPRPDTHVSPLPAALRRGGASVGSAQTAGLQSCAGRGDCDRESERRVC